MKPVKQVKLKSDDDGDCFCACIASILELPLSEVPHFTDRLWFRRYNNWLRKFGLKLLRVKNIDLRNSGYTIEVGDSPRYVYHAVVCKNGKRVHDPHPSNEFLLPNEMQGEIKRYIFVPQLAAEFIKAAVAMSAEAREA